MCLPAVKWREPTLECYSCIMIVANISKNRRHHPHQWLTAAVYEKVVASLD